MRPEIRGRALGEGLRWESLAAGVGLAFRKQSQQKLCCRIVSYCSCWCLNASVGKQCINFSVIKLIKNPSANAY